MSENIFLSTYNHLNDLVDKCIKEHKDHKYPDGIICDTRYIAEITHKEHKNVLRDIDELIINLNNQGRRTYREVAKVGPSSNIELAKVGPVAENRGEISQVAKTEPSLILQGENGELVKSEESSSNNLELAKNGLSSIEVAKSESVAENLDENLEVAKSEGRLENRGEINLNHEFRIIESLYKGEDNSNRSVYQLSPVAFLVLMGRYNDTIVYCLANFFYRVMKEMEYSLDKLLNTNLTKLDEASELVALRESNNPVDKQLFTEYLPKYLALFGEKENLVELMTGIKTGNKSDFCYATSLDVWKITGKTEHNKITRDIKEMISKLKDNGFDVEAHYLEAYRKLENNRTIKVYEMDEIGFLTIMGKYYSWILYDLAKFYISMKDNIEISGEGLLSIKAEVLLEAYEVLKDIAIIKFEEYDRVNRNLFTDIDYPNMSNDEIANETERIYKENNSRIKELINNFKQKYENKNILN